MCSHVQVALLFINSGRAKVRCTLVLICIQKLLCVFGALINKQEKGCNTERTPK
jgi:hypothetical protein